MKARSNQNVSPGVTESILSGCGEGSGIEPLINASRTPRQVSISNTIRMLCRSGVTGIHAFYRREGQTGLRRKDARQ